MDRIKFVAEIREHFFKYDIFGLVVGKNNAEEPSTEEDPPHYAVFYNSYSFSELSYMVFFILR